MGRPHLLLVLVLSLALSGAWWSPLVQEEFVATAENLTKGIMQGEHTAKQPVKILMWMALLGIFFRTLSSTSDRQCSMH